MYVGPMMVTLLERCAPLLGEALPTLLVAVLRRLGFTENMMLKMARACFWICAVKCCADLAQMLVLVLAQTAQSHARALVDFLVTLTDQPPGALAAALRMWCEAQPDYRLPFERALTVTGLCNILALGDPRVAAVTVKGEPVVDVRGGRSTRSRPAALQYTTVPFMLRVAQLLGDELTRAEAATADVQAADGEDDYEDESSDSDAPRDAGESPFADAALYADQILESGIYDSDDEEEEGGKADPLTRDHPVMQISLHVRCPCEDNSVY
jgi:hypothetical protein